jgi:hypothetical protein
VGRSRVSSCLCISRLTRASAGQAHAAARRAFRSSPGCRRPGVCGHGRLLATARRNLVVPPRVTGFQNGMSSPSSTAPTTAATDSAFCSSAPTCEPRDRNVMRCAITMSPSVRADQKTVRSQPTRVSSVDLQLACARHPGSLEQTTRSRSGRGSESPSARVGLVPSCAQRARSAAIDQRESSASPSASSPTR